MPHAGSKINSMVKMWQAKIKSHSQFRAAEKDLLGQIRTHHLPHELRVAPLMSTNLSTETEGEEEELVRWLSSQQAFTSVTQMEIAMDKGSRV